MQSARSRFLVPALALLIGGGVVLTEVNRVEAGPSDKEKAQAEKKGLAKPAKVARRIDVMLAKRWKKDKLKVADRTTDAEFLRRLSLDLTGSIPSEEVARRFLAKRGGDREALIKELIGSKAYSRHMATRWANLLVGRRYLIRLRTYKRVMRMQRAKRKMAERMMGGEKGMDEGSIQGYGADNEILTFTEWLERQFSENRPFGELTTDLLAAEGTPLDNPAVHYMLSFREGKAPETTGHVMRVFQGLQLQCAQCHDDKYEPEWTQRVFWGVTAFFTRTKIRRLPPPGMTRQEAKKAGKRGPFQVRDLPRGQVRIPAPPGETGRLVLPEFITGEVISPAKNVKRRVELAKIITAQDNPYFARAIVNRTWSFFFGRGVIDPVDAINQDDFALPELMEVLEDDFRRSGYDLRRLVSILIRTRAYQLSSRGKAEGRADSEELFARMPLRQLAAEQLFYSVVQATGIEDVGNGNRRVRRRLEQMKFRLLRQFVVTFGTEDEDGESVEEGTIPQALMRLNGPLTNNAVRPRPGHPVYDRLFRMDKVVDRIEMIYLRVLSRRPTAKERKKVLKFLSLPENRQALHQANATADVIWALLNSAEFSLNH
ncbi:MAG: DUF1553 domain-containing protein [Planctomycetes bacterium]|nr:DUF1553 domain-containing protein [Planctomycetota bacterium]